MRPHYHPLPRMYSHSSTKTAPHTPSMPMIQFSNVFSPLEDFPTIPLTNVEKMPNGLSKEIDSTYKLLVTSNHMNRSSYTTELNTGPTTPSTFHS